MKFPSSPATIVLALVAHSLSSSVVDVDAANIAVATAGDERNLGSGDFDFDSFEGLWEATGLWRYPTIPGLDADNALAVFKCTKTTNFPGDYCEVTIKINSLWGCAPSLGPALPDASSAPCTYNNPYFSELVGKITKDQFDPDTGSLVANLYQRSAFIGEGCENTVSTGSGTLFQLKLNAGGSNGYAKSFSIENADSDTGEVFPPGSDCGSQNFYKIGGGFK